MRNASIARETRALQTSGSDSGIGRGSENQVPALPRNRHMDFTPIVEAGVYTFRR